MRARRPPTSAMIRFTMLTSVERNEARQPVERGGARKVLKGQCARAMIERPQFLDIRRDGESPAGSRWADRQRPGRCLATSRAPEAGRPRCRPRSPPRAAAPASAIASAPSVTDAADPTAGGAPRSRPAIGCSASAARRQPRRARSRRSATPWTRWSPSTTAIASEPVVSIDCATSRNARIRAAGLERLPADDVVQEHLLRIARVLRPLDSLR